MRLIFPSFEIKEVEESANKDIINKIRDKMYKEMLDSFDRDILYYLDDVNSIINKKFYNYRFYNYNENNREFEIRFFNSLKKYLICG